MSDPTKPIYECTASLHSVHQKGTGSARSIDQGVADYCHGGQSKLRCRIDKPAERQVYTDLLTCLQMPSDVTFIMLHALTASKNSPWSKDGLLLSVSEPEFPDEVGEIPIIRA
jgi:hypothetical protein